MTLEEILAGNAPMPEDTSDKEKKILMKYRKATAQQKKLIESLIDAVILSRTV